MENLHTIRHAKFNDQERIIEFIKNNWSKDHIFVKSPDFFHYHYKHNEGLNFILAESNHSSEVEGVLGYICYGEKRFNTDIFLSFWKVMQNCLDPVLGIKLLTFLKDELSPKGLHCTGINKKTIGIYKYMGHFTGKLQQYVYLNDSLSNFEVAKVPENFTQPHNENKPSEESLVPTSSLKGLDTSVFEANLPYKEPSYLINRYFQHPIYCYENYFLKEGHENTALLITRPIEVKSRKVLRVIDYIGPKEKLSQALALIINKMKREDYEYVDLYIHGVSKEILTGTGLSLVSDHPGLVIPNYFEPFEQKNVDIHFFTSMNKDEVRIFKGDGDQDRPNYIERL